MRFPLPPAFARLPFPARCGVGGGILIFIWSAMVLVFATPFWADLLVGLAGLGLAGTWGWHDRERILRVLKSPGMRYGSNAIAFAAGIAGIIVLLNVLATRHSVRADLTAGGFYSLSDQTVKTLKGLKQRIKVTAFFKSGDQTAAQMRDLLEEYRHHTKMVEYEFVDPDKTPARAQIYRVTSYNTTVLETADGRRKDLSPAEIFGYQFVGGREPQREFKGEVALTSALISLAGDKRPTVYFLEGHGERSLEDGGENGATEIRRSLEADALTVSTLNLMKSGKIPEDAGLIVVAGPRGGLSSAEQKVLRAWLRKNGRMLVLLDPDYLGGMEGLLGDWGITLLNGIAVDPRAYYFVDPLTPIPSYGDHPITADLAKQRVGILFPGSCALTIKPVKGVVASPLLRTTPESWLERAIAAGTPKFNKGTDTKGPLTLAAAVAVEGAVPIPDATGQAPAPSSPTPRLVVYGDSDYVANKIKAVSDGNFDIFINSVNWLMGASSSISIRPKQPDQRRIFLTNVQSSLLWYFAVLLTPLAVLGAGAWRWWRRRSL